MEIPRGNALAKSLMNEGYEDFSEFSGYDLRTGVAPTRNEDYQELKAKMAEAVKNQSDVVKHCQDAAKLSNEEANIQKMLQKLAIVKIEDSRSCSSSPDPDSQDRDAIARLVRDAAEKNARRALIKRNQERKQR
jgi:hypothetical protein